MEEFQPEELAVFLDDLHRRPNGIPSLMLRCAQSSGYTKEFASYFNPFQDQDDARALTAGLPISETILAVVSPDSRFSACLFLLRRNTVESKLRHVRARICRQVVFHPGFQGLPDDPALAMAYRQNPDAKEKFEQALTLTAATALYRALGGRVGSLYFMEKGWNHAYLLTPTYLPTTACC